MHADEAPFLSHRARRTRRPSEERGMSMQNYVALNVRMNRVLIEDFSPANARKSAIRDWHRDIARAAAESRAKKTESTKDQIRSAFSMNDYLPYETFFASVFELVDTWTDAVSERVYVAFLKVRPLTHTLLVDLLSLAPREMPSICDIPLSSTHLATSSFQDLVDAVLQPDGSGLRQLEDVAFVQGLTETDDSDKSSSGDDTDDEQASSQCSSSDSSSSDTATDCSADECLDHRSAPPGSKVRLSSVRAPVDRLQRSALTPRIA